MNKNINKLFIYFIYLYLKKIILFIKIKNIFLIYNFKLINFFHLIFFDFCVLFNFDKIYL